jgi:hypothetical protein
MFATSETISDTTAYRLVIALERWESEGGALPPPKRTQFEL